MCEGRFRSEIRDGHGLLKREGTGHDFTVNGAKLLVRHRPGVVAADAFEHGALTVRGVNLLARRHLDFADGKDVLRALIEQLDDLGVELVNRLTMFGNVQSGGRMLNYAGRIKSVSRCQSRLKE